MVAQHYPLGEVVATLDALNVFVAARQDPDELMGRHRSGDWRAIRGRRSPAT
jgi:hypothetical protein